MYTLVNIKNLWLSYLQVLAGCGVGFRLIVERENDNRDIVNSIFILLIHAFPLILFYMAIRSLFNNQLTGAIPNNIGYLTSLQFL